MPGKPDREFAREASRCVKCGSCAPQCPVFLAMGCEEHSPRGRLALLEAASQGVVSESPLYRRYLETCLLCGACQDACPNRVSTLDAFMAGRQHLAEERGIAMGKGFILRHLLRAASLLRLTMRTGWLFQRFAFSRIPAESGLHFRISLPQVPSERLLPEVSRHFFTELFDGLVREGEGPRVGIFSGCMVNYFYSDIGESMVRLLGALDATVVVPPEQGCCGMPALTAGARRTVVELARRNLEAFESHQLDAVVTGCASCGANIKSNYRWLLAESGVEPRRAEEFIAKVCDINEFLSRAGLPGYLRRSGKSSGSGVLPVTWHNPCHLGRLQGVLNEPVELIRSIPGVAFVPMADADRCCGMGGAFSLEHYDLSMKINDAKVRNIRDSGARAVVTSCPACILHIRDGLRRNRVEGVEVLHVVELINRVLIREEHPSAGGEEAWEESTGFDGHEGI